ncbi:23S rRNA (guanosine(2251)-2'-O)-methyltransferase RlmB [Halarcobacter ebronensis]|uniref:23S rRNA (Guanosine(2251)-2'-O)-methyltransferase RlmB n=1 Tax=Halarcobacter ebronensis TaxID=1462615 RepID=A0A4Q1APH6_9BACT|nr:23S rRNA (guanosine(2251)-2'-O)-methyltransferase RlmB [Halarcobacter ebronensis]QKF80716.1 rRNA methyltransferase, TrmH family, group 3 [Halarcobacter ebronensis]RXK08509.1 23S rRNA (guanosine(2251)-2'-O)-methyltransferase RlmB [Halarcobacter ebronensis]
MIIYGKQVVLYVLEKHPELIEEVLFSKEIDPKLFKKFTSLNKKVIKLDNKKAQGLAKGGNHQGFFLRLREFGVSTLKELKDSDFIVVLDGITDVGNIGAICRTAYSLGVDAIVASSVKQLNYEGIARTSSGALFDIPFCHNPNSLDVANELKQYGFKLFGAAMDGKDLKKFEQKKEKIALVLGSEGEGLSSKMIKKLDEKVSIKMSNDFDSLNVSVAGGILIYNLKN